ncbi:MAG: hypothetical protein RL140_743 [Actinomycetota bacterium]|jgi:predicted metal-dependent phosphoesterase TrpH
MKIDLHCHSTHSDGKETLSEIFQYASEAGLDVLAITDHDTVAGWAEASELAAQHGITFVPGIEITTKHHEISTHLLAYLPNPEYAPLINRLAEVRESRSTRIERFVENLAPDFEGISMDAVRATQTSEGKSPGRPHIADALVNLGFFKDRGEAFDGPLSKRSPYYVPSDGIHTIEAVKLVRAAGGVPIMAHPLSRHSGPGPFTPHPKMRENFLELIKAGIGGFEVDHREVKELQREWLVSLATEFNLIMTGSSDYHGMTGKPNRLGEKTTSLEMLKRIESEATGSVIQWA